MLRTNQPDSLPKWAIRLSRKYHIPVFGYEYVASDYQSQLVVARLASVVCQQWEVLMPLVEKQGFSSFFVEPISDPPIRLFELDWKERQIVLFPHQVNIKTLKVLFIKSLEIYLESLPPLE